jgi:hypothetical protein
MLIIDKPLWTLDRLLEGEPEIEPEPSEIPKTRGVEYVYESETSVSSD